MVEIHVYQDVSSLAQAAAGCFGHSAVAAVAARGRFAVALSGGSTPRQLYRRLARRPFCDDIPWASVHVFWGDERCVPPDHPGSNYRLAHDELLSHVSLPTGNSYRVLGELEPEAAAAAYTAVLNAFFGSQPPRFDLVLLGMGSDGHTASLFPHSPTLRETEWRAVAVSARFQGRPARRVTLNPPAINAARQILFLVTGGDKAETARAVLEGPYRPDVFPAQLIRPADGRLSWLLDEGAAGELTLP